MAAALPLLWRRRFPLPGLVASHSIVLAYWLLGYPGGPIFLSPLIAFFNAVLHGQRVGAWIVLAVGFVGFTFLPTVVNDEPTPTIGHVVGIAAWLLVIAAAADLLRVRGKPTLECAREGPIASIALLPTGYCPSGSSHPGRAK